MLTPSEMQEAWKMQTWRLTEKKKSKSQAAERLGLLPRLQECGWAGLSAKEAGRIGGCLRGRGAPAASPCAEDDRS